jgi:hypothetical protein
VTASGTYLTQPADSAASAARTRCMELSGSSETSSDSGANLQSSSSFGLQRNS